ncbi:MAG: DUF1841 family protein [Gammaproteobacteria bacterium]|nr:DUF1841 family protein [Gammaproteobacteria bacterium]
MYEGKERTEMRQVFFDAWRRRKAGVPMEPLAMAICNVVEQHPEYHAMLDDPEGALDRDFTPESGRENPFLHMSMHLGIREQVATARPRGVEQIYETLCRRHGDAHVAEHLMMECLGEALWQAQRSGVAPDESAYLLCLKGLSERARS